MKYSRRWRRTGQSNPRSRLRHSKTVDGIAQITLSVSVSYGEPAPRRRRRVHSLPPSAWISSTRQNFAASGPRTIARALMSCHGLTAQKGAPPTTEPKHIVIYFLTARHCRQCISISPTQRKEAPFTQPTTAPTFAAGTMARVRSPRICRQSTTLAKRIQKAVGVSKSTTHLAYRGKLATRRTASPMAALACRFDFKTTNWCGSAVFPARL